MTLSEDAPRELLAAAARTGDTSAATAGGGAGAEGGDAAAAAAAVCDDDDAGMYDHYLVQLDVVQTAENAAGAGELTLCAFNVSAVERVAYISALTAPGGEEVAFFDRHGVRLSVGISTEPRDYDEEEEEMGEAAAGAEAMGDGLDREAAELQDRLNEAAQMLRAQAQAAEADAGGGGGGGGGMDVEEMETMDAGGDGRAQGEEEDDEEEEMGGGVGGAVAAAFRSESQSGGGFGVPSVPTAAAPIVPCTTFICIIPPYTAVRIAHVRGEPLLSKLTFPLSKHPDPEGRAQAVTPIFSHFPLGGIVDVGAGASCLPCGDPLLPGGVAVAAVAADGVARGGARGGGASAGSVPVAASVPSSPFLCTQGFGGRLTHFFPESFHAFDLRCVEGTEVVALADGVVREVLELNDLTGVHCENLRKWNSIAIDIVVDGVAFFVEYLHIMPHSSLVQVGDVVRAGQVICLSGNVGFAPEAHVHIEVHRADDPGGASVRFELEPPQNRSGNSSSGRSSGAPSSRRTNGTSGGYTPIAGRWYGPTGEASAPVGVGSEFDEFL